MYLFLKLIISFTIHPAVENTIGVKRDNGTWSGLIGSLLQGVCRLSFIIWSIFLITIVYVEVTLYVS